MGEKIVIGPINKGLRTDVTPFNIDNDSFPTLINAYQWRGRIKRKRGTQFLNRLSRFLGITNGAGNLVVTIAPVPITSGISSFTVGSDVFVDPGGASPVGLLTNSTGTGSLNRTTGVLTITGSQAATAVIYYPTLPVMGLEDFVTTSNAFPFTVAFDTVYSYNINTTFPYTVNDVSFYNNPSTATYVGYVQKATWTPVSWNGQDYQQFWTTNYQGAMWATNGINVPFSATNVGMQFNTITAVAIGAAGPPAIVTITTGTNHGLVVGDFVFINEIIGMTGINWQTGYVTVVPAVNQITVEFPNATIAGAWVSGGIVQYLTNRSDTTKDCIRWYNGDPTNGNPTAPVFQTGTGWVNFMPPLSQSAFSISDLPPRVYYLVGARMIVPFKDRLLFFGPVIQASSGSPIYLQDTVIYSQNGTPYYTASYTNSPNAAIDTPTSATNVFNPILVPINQTASPSAYFEDNTGFGGFITAGLDQPINTVGINRDTLILGFTNLQVQFAYTGNDIVPFNFFIINSELGSSSPFSSIILDKGVLTRGSKGYIITNQVEASRFDLDIPDQVFKTRLTNNGTERYCAQRDFINEWVYFTYPTTPNDPDVTDSFNFPNQTLLYNYRDNSWAIFNESYTTYGQFRKQTGFTWATVGNVYPTWAQWNDPWDAGESELLQPDMIAGNQQGFVLIKDVGTGEGNSLYIQNISSNTITSPNHGLDTGNFIIINGALGTVGTQVNGEVFSVTVTGANTFILNPVITTATYLGGGTITRMYVPQIQTKQFPVAWGFGRKVRIGVQQYLLSTTFQSQITLLIFLSQNSSNAYNEGNIVPQIGSVNNSLIYSTVLHTCPESTNLGLTPANSNLQMPTAAQQDQIWHRINTSLIGDTVQLGFTLSDTQMRDLESESIAFAITGATQANPCVLTCVGQFETGQLIQIAGVVGMTELNGNIYQVIISDATTVTINVDSTAFTAYISDGTATLVSGINGFAEIELHGIILDVTPSQLLA